MFLIIKLLIFGVTVMVYRSKRQNSRLGLAGLQQAVDMGLNGGKHSFSHRVGKT